MVGVSPDGIGDSDMDRPTGLRTVGSFVSPEVGVMDEADRNVLGDLAYGLGVVAESGLKLWPVSRFDLFAPPFHAGREPITDPGRGAFTAGVLMLAGVARTDRRAMFAFRGGPPCAGVGREEWRRLPICEGDLCLASLAAGVDGSRPRLAMITEDGGELPGVSWPLAVVDRSLESMLEMLSRSCWPPYLPDCSSSTVASISLICSFKMSHLDWIS